MLFKEITKNKLCLRFAVGLNRIVNGYVNGLIQVIGKLLGTTCLNRLFYLINDISLGK